MCENTVNVELKLAYFMQNIIKICHVLYYDCSKLYFHDHNYNTCIIEYQIFWGKIAFLWPIMKYKNTLSIHKSCNRNVGPNRKHCTILVEVVTYTSIFFPKIFVSRIWNSVLKLLTPKVFCCIDFELLLRTSKSK